MTNENNEEKLFLVGIEYTSIHERLVYAKSADDIKNERMDIFDSDETDIFETDDYKILDVVEVNESDYYPPKPTEEELEAKRIKDEEERAEREANECKFNELLMEVKKLNKKLGKSAEVIADMFKDDDECDDEHECNEDENY